MSNKTAEHILADLKECPISTIQDSEPIYFNQCEVLKAMEACAESITNLLKRGNENHNS